MVGLLRVFLLPVAFRFFIKPESDLDNDSCLRFSRNSSLHCKIISRNPNQVVHLVPA